MTDDRVADCNPDDPDRVEPLFFGIFLYDPETLSTQMAALPEVKITTKAEVCKSSVETSFLQFFVFSRSAHSF